MRKAYSIGVFTLITLCLLLILKQGQTHRARSPLLPPALEVADLSAPPQKAQFQKNALREEGSQQSKSELSAKHIIHNRIEDAPPWTIRYGKEFWRQRSKTKETPPGVNTPAGVDIHNVIDRVSHALRSTTEGLVANDRKYSASLDQDGFTLTIKPPSDRAISQEGAGDTGAPASESALDQARFETRQIFAGSETLYTPTKATEPWQVTGNTAQRQLNSSVGLVEHYEASDRGVEVTWVLQQPPPKGSGLTIQGELSGVTWMERDEKGSLFGGKTGTPTIRVSDVTLVDARGVRSSLPLQVQNNLIEVNIPAQLLADAHYPIAIDPLIGPAFPLIYNIQTNGQFQPAVAGNGTNYLVVWTDQRDQPTLGNGNDIWGTRVSPVGVVLEPSGILINTNGGNTPRLASCAGNWLVVWHGWTVGVPGDDDIYGARVSGGGTVLDSQGFGICTHNGDQNYPAVAASGTNYLVAWDDGRVFGGAATEIYTTRVTTSGTVMDGNGQVLSGIWAGFPQAASDGTNFTVVWHYRNMFLSGHGIAYRRVSHTNTPSGSETFVEAANAHSQPDIAWSTGAGNYLITYGAPSGVRGNRVSPAGSLLDGSGFTINNTVPGNSAAVACNGSDYLVAWTHALSPSASEVYGARVRASDATVKDPVAINIANRVIDPFGIADVGNIGTNFCVVWDDSSNPDSDTGDVFGAIVLGSGLVTSIAPYSTDGTSATTKWWLSADAIGSTYLVAWNDGDVRATLITESGLVQTPRGISICVTNSIGSVDLAASASHFMVTWLDSRGIYAARVSTAGYLYDTNGFQVNGVVYNDELVISASGTNYLVVWNGGSSILGKRVTTMGTVLDGSAITVANTFYGSTHNPDVASIGTNWLVVWDDIVDYTDIRAGRVTSAGVALDTSAGFQITDLPDFQGWPRVAANGTNYLVTWVDERNGNSDIYGARLNSSGTLLDTAGIPICLDTNIQCLGIDIASDGGDFLVAWPDGRHGGSLYATRVGNDGYVSDTSGFYIDTALFGASSTKPGVASGTRGKYLVAHTSGNSFGRFIEMQRLIPITLSSSTFSMRLLGGQIGSQVQVESSPDLSTWSAFQTVTIGSGGVVDFSDTGVTGVNARFYRASSARGRADTAIGFYRVTVPATNASGAGFFLAVNQLDNPTNNTVPTLLAGVPTNTAVLTWTNGAFVTNKWNGSTWTDSTSPLNPGIGFFISNPGSNAFTVSFFGTIRQGVLSQSAAGSAHTYLGSPVPEPSNIVRMEYPPTADDYVSVWIPASQTYGYTVTYYDGFGWYNGNFDPDPGSLDIGEGCLLRNEGAAKTWLRTFSVW